MTTAPSPSGADMSSGVEHQLHLVGHTPGEPANLPATLLAALEWSHELLSDEERLLLRRLAVFSGGWTLEAAEALCRDEDVHVFDVLARLVARSLVICERTGTVSRYRFLETFREFARSKLAASGEACPVQHAHAVWSVSLAEQAEGVLMGADQATGLDRLEVEYANLQAALNWSLAHGRHELALRLAAALVLFWLVRGRMTEGRMWLQRCLAPASEVAPKLRVKGLWGVGLLAGMLGDFDGARVAGKESLELSRNSGDLHWEARALNVLGFVCIFSEPAGAQPLLEASVDAAERARDPWCLANSLGLLGFAEIFRGDFVAAGPCFERCLAAAGQTGDEQGLRMGQLGTGYVALERGAHQQAQAALTNGLEVARRLGDPFWTAVGLTYLVELARVRGDHLNGRRWSEEAVVLARQTGSLLLLSFCLSFAARAAADAGVLSEAHDRAEETLALSRRAQRPGHAAVALLAQGEVAMARAEPEPAGAVFEEALAVARQSGDRLIVAASLLGCARAIRARGDSRQATPLAHAALELSTEIGHPPGIASALETVAGLAVEERRLEYAARLFGAAHTLRDGTGCICPPSEQPTRDSDLALLIQGLDRSALEGAWKQGAGLSPAEACAYAHRGRGRRRRPSTGWASLTPVERKVTGLVAEGLTNAEIGERLFISRRTVQTHLSHVFAKLGLRSRRELARAAPPFPGTTPADSE